jgi:hypothetical protein
VVVSRLTLVVFAFVIAALLKLKVGRRAAPPR